MYVGSVEGLGGCFSTVSESILDNLSFIWVSIEPENSLVTIKYASASGNGLLLQQWLSNASQQDPLPLLMIGNVNLDTSFPNGTIVSDFVNLKVGDADAQFVEGTWVGTDCCGWKWEPTPYLKRLRWKTEGRSYELLFMGLPDMMSKDDLINIAEKLTKK